MCYCFCFACTHIIILCSIAKSSCDGFAALQKGLAMVLQHCEGVLQWFVPGVSNIAETLTFFFIARGVSNSFAALQKGVGPVLLHCHGFLQWLCFAVLRGSCNAFALVFDCEGVLRWFGFTVLPWSVAMAPV